VEREAFLSRIRGALAGTDVPPLPEALPATFSSGDGRMFERFAEELGGVGGEAHLLTAGELQSAVAEVARNAGNDGEGASASVVATGVPFREQVLAGLADAGCEVLEVTRDEAARVGLGVTGADLGVCSTGSLLIRMGPGAPRAASLLPPVHLAILPAARLVPGFEELFDAVPELVAGSSQCVLVTGPSRTGDIELSLVRGVHGPMRVIVLVVSSEANP
jgi:L-lactate dehydrogenase complex protein LldG